jgi:hypothetical protein
MSKAPVEKKEKKKEKRKRSALQGVEPGRLNMFLSYPACRLSYLVWTLQRRLAGLLKAIQSPWMSRLFGRIEPVKFRSDPVLESWIQTSFGQVKTQPY